MGKMRNVYKIVIGKPQEKRPLGRPRRRWKNNVETYLEEIVFQCVIRTHQALDRVQYLVDINMEIKHWVP
jgi:hypothetical protein